MPEQIELFVKEKPKKRIKKKRGSMEFEAVFDGFGTKTIEKTEKPHECFACDLPIAVGSKAEKETPIADGRSQWQYARYRHLPTCPPPEDEP